MKATLHPPYHQVTVTCNCGASFVTGSTKKTIQVEICSRCHPFFTGEMKFVDTVGRIERFQAKQQAASPKKKNKKTRQTSQTGPRTLAELRAQAR